MTIEDAAELQLHQRHVLRLEARPPNIEGEGAIPIRDLVRNSLRMRPDRIIVGECRGPEALDMLQAMNTGHDGSLSTVHANAPRDALARIETMVLMAGYDLPVRAIRQQVSSALDMIVHIERMEDGSRRCTAITEVQRMESDVITMQDIFEFKIDSFAPDGTINGALRPTGLRPVFLDKFAKRGIELPAGLFSHAPRHDECRGSPSVTRIVRSFILALLALVVAAAIGALPAAAADNGIQVVEAGSPLFPDRSYVLTLPKPVKPALTAESVAVTENGKPVKDLSVLSSASGEGIGTVLLIDASNSMKGSIKSAMQAARAFAARNPGQPLSVVFFNSKPTVALPLTTSPKQIKAALAKAPKLGEGTRLYDALAAAVAQVRGSALGAARVVVLSDGDDVGSITTSDAAIAQLQSEKIRVFTVGIESPDFKAEDLQQLAESTGGTYASATSAKALTKVYDQLGFELGNEYLLRYHSEGQAGPERRRRGRRQGRRAGVVRVHEPPRRDGRAVQAGLARQVLPVVVPHPARRLPRPRADRPHHPLALEPPHEQEACPAAGRLRHPSRGGERSGAPQGGRRAPRRGRPAEASSGATGDGWKGSPRTSTSRRSSAIRAPWCGSPSSRGSFWR